MRVNLGFPLSYSPFFLNLGYASEMDYHDI